MTHNDYPDREKAVIPASKIEAPESPKIIDEYMKPESVSQEVWDTLTDQQKKQHIAQFKANKIHAERHGGK